MDGPSIGTLEKEYFRKVSNTTECFVEGTDWSQTSIEQCICIENYFGEDCGIPDSVWFGHYETHVQGRRHLRRRKSPRRLIQGVLVNHEFDFLDMRIGSSYNVMDAYITQESNYTTLGSPRRLEIFEKLSSGWLGPYQDKLIYVFLSHFKEAWTENGWLAESYIRNHLSLKGLPLISDKHEDDLFLLFDSDEIPNRSVLLFLKLYEGYSEPIRLGYRWTVFGFFWLKADEPGLLNYIYNTQSEKLLQLYNVCTLGMMEKVYGNNAMLLRKNAYKHKKLKKAFKVYAASHDVRVWNIGTLGHYAGYHCSWCFDPEGIRRKLLSAQKNDNPRWGDYPEKTNLTYIQTLIKSGGWFDGTHPYIRVEPMDKNYAPDYVLRNADKYEYLLIP
eukprot:TRINITY_DN4245_c0_g1_i1.p1 TRINITY_DN4245_c0_g1~~TRINITY_DN4245_c0_g1_i1.p1  ORF type:complete len:387 (+),score=60.14 TRINITY_DN4245_c0_g1_i1:421-1581(+)